MVKNVRLTRLTLVQSVDSVCGSARRREYVYLHERRGVETDLQQVKPVKALSFDFLYEEDDGCAEEFFALKRISGYLAIVSALILARFIGSLIVARRRSP